MGARAFELAAFYERVAAAPKEQHAIRQDLVRGLKDYFEFRYGYDRFGAETVFMLPERMGDPHVYGFALVRLLHDRRLSDEIKSAAAGIALDNIDYPIDDGLPIGVFAALLFLSRQNRLPLADLRFALVASAGVYQPFAGLEKGEGASFIGQLLQTDAMPQAERLFWAHSLIARHQDQSGAADMIVTLLSTREVQQEYLMELCRAWIHFRQPRLDVEAPSERENWRATVVADHMAFWVAHAPSWPTSAMMRHGLIWLARLGEDPVRLVDTYIDYRSVHTEQVHAAVAEIIGEHHPAMPEELLRSVIERGVAMSGSIATRRKFYRLGADLFGQAYLERAGNDSASSVRQWAARQLQIQV